MQFEQNTAASADAVSSVTCTDMFAHWVIDLVHAVICAHCSRVVDALADLSALYIQRRFGIYFVDISDVTMETVAVASGNDLEVFHVENCTCDVSSNHVAGTHSCRCH